MNEEIELASERAIIDIPGNCVKIRLVCTIFLDGEKQELQTVERTLSMSEIKEAVRKAADGYIDEEDMFYLTKKGEDWLNWRDEQEAMERAGY